MRLSRVTRFILRRAGWIAAAGTLVAGVGGYYTVELYKNLRTDMEELLPMTARSVIDFNEVLTRLESIDNLAVLIFTPKDSKKDSEASKRFMIDLAAKLEKAPPEAKVASIEYRIDKELKFFSDRKLLYMDLADLNRVRDYIRERVEYEKALYNPLNIFSDQELKEPFFDFEKLRRKYEKRASAYSRFKDGFYATPDGTIRVMLIHMAGKVSGMTGMHALKGFVAQSIAELDPKSYGNLEIKYASGIQNTIEEQAALVEDLGMSGLMVIVFVGLALFVFFRAKRATAALLLSLLMGVFWSFGLAFKTVGYLNANSAFLGSIIIGNGINFGTIFLARYLEERRYRHSHAVALDMALRGTATATGIAALAAGLSYGSLMLTSFRGFSQFGQIGLMGMILCWIASYFLLPAFLTLLEIIYPVVPPHKAKQPKAFVSHAIADLVSRFPKQIWVVSVIATLFSVAAFARYNPNTFLESDLTKLRAKKSMEKGSGYYSLFIDDIFGRYLSPMVILPRTIEDTREIAARLEARKEADGKKSLIADVATLDEFLPVDQQRKIRVMQEIKTLLPAKLLRRIPPEDRKLVMEFLEGTSLRPVKAEDLPTLVRDKFTEKDGSIGKLVVVEPPITGEVLLRQGQKDFVVLLRQMADSVTPGTPVAGSLAITYDLIESISADGPKASLFSFLAVVILVIVLFRNFATIGLCLFALMMGILWLAGIVLGFGIKINFLNFIALPITFGIGIDYGVNIFQRYREEGGASMLRVIRGTGGAVAMCSFTTIVGYGSLLMADNQAFKSFGLIAVLGEITCVVAALFALPALLQILSSGKRRRASD